MADQPPSLLEELQRRRVFRAVIAYGLAAFGALQIDGWRRQGS